MGYIAPIPQYQYQQYSSRVLESKVQDPNRIMSVQRVDIRSKFRRTLEEKNQVGYVDKQQNELKEQKPHQPHKKIALDLLSVEIGKGRYVSEYI